MEHVLDQLQAFITANPTRAFFDPPADDASIDAVEGAIGLRLPKSYRAFLRRFNGGFINICGLGPEHQRWDIKTARWNSNWLFGTEDLVTQYEQARGIGGWDRIPYLPICQTNGQEHLVVFPRDDNSEPPILDAFHETSDWGQLYPDFGAMVQAYVEGEGVIETIASG